MRTSRAERGRQVGDERPAVELGRVGVLDQAARRRDRAGRADADAGPRAEARLDLVDEPADRLDRQRVVVGAARRSAVAPAPGPRRRSPAPRSWCRRGRRRCGPGRSDAAMRARLPRSPRARRRADARRSGGGAQGCLRAAAAARPGASSRAAAAAALPRAGAALPAACSFFWCARSSRSAGCVIGLSERPPKSVACGSPRLLLSLMLRRSSLAESALRIASSKRDQRRRRRGRTAPRRRCTCRARASAP